MTSEGVLGNARPCYNCLNLMKIVGIKRVYYSVKPDMIVCERVKDMISIQASGVCKFIRQKYYHAPINDNEFFKELLTRLFPSRVKRDNLNYFLNHNFKIVLPDYGYKIVNTKKINRIVFFDENECPIHQSDII
tara:strand:- start:230 stop:631 length:402 start_codon:yes stop_codon:yes gene_type:complete